MNKERKALRRLLPGRRGARLFGFVLLFLALSEVEKRLFNTNLQNGLMRR